MGRRQPHTHNSSITEQRVVMIRRFEVFCPLLDCLILRTVFHLSQKGVLFAFPIFRAGATRMDYVSQKCQVSLLLSVGNSESKENIHPAISSDGYEDDRSYTCCQ